jgi:hypothetical protein
MTWVLGHHDEKLGHFGSYPVTNRIIYLMDHDRDPGR